MEQKAEESNKIFILISKDNIPLVDLLLCSASEQRLSIVLMMIAIIFILSSLPRIIIMMYDIIIIDTLRYVI